MRILTRISFLATICTTLYAQNALQCGTPVLDRPTLTVLGVQLPISGDANFNATVSVQYRVTGSTTWHNALPLFRVHPETVASYTVAPQFAGSIFDLQPGTTYDIQLQAVDPDGGSQNFILNGTTRSVPTDPVNPVNVTVTDSASLTTALFAAQPGQIITLANGIYSGSFQIYAAGTPTNPIVIRGASEDGVILDAGNCAGCNVFEFYGAGYVHLEQMTLQNANRGIRFQSSGAIGNVVRRVHIKNTQLGIGGNPNQYDFYIADNILEGVLIWPHVYWDDGGTYASNDGIAVWGFGHVVAYNQVSGYGDAMKTIQDGARANDFYGNLVLYTYDNAIELDGSEGNTRCFRNLYMNTFSPISFQPIHGGPAYAFRNVVVNSVSEQLKFHAQLNPTQEPSGVLVYNNTVVSQSIPELYLQTPASSHYFAIENNLFISPAAEGPEAADWTGPIDHGLFDYNGYFPDGIFRFNMPQLGGYFYQPNFAGLQSLGMEPHGMLATGPLFASGLTAPSTYTTQMPPADATLAPKASVLDQGLILPNINDMYIGAGPDLGALELGCPKPSYGPRPFGTDETNEVVGCTTTSPPTSALSPSVFIDVPSAKATLTGTASISGWAMSVIGPAAVSSVAVFVDGSQIGTATYGTSRPDVCAAMPAPIGCPNVGWTYNLNVTTLAAGSHILKIVATDTAGNSGSNAVTFTTTAAIVAVQPSVFIEVPSPKATLTGTASISGWAIENMSVVGPAAIGSVTVFVDGSQVGTATYGTSRPDVCTTFPGRLGCPNVGWTYNLDLTSLATGSHILRIVATDAAGTSGSSQTTFMK
jgi:hypothetical protein